MQKSSTKIITALLLAALTLGMLPLAVNASLGNIAIVSPDVSSGNRDVAAGGTVVLNFTGVTWSGGQFYLLMSKDGFSSTSTGDVQYTPTFNVVNLTSTTYISNYTQGGKTWRLVNNTITGPIASNIGGGNYYIKAFDGATAVAVTNTYLFITGALTVSPASANPLQAIYINGSGFTANTPINITYRNELTSKTVIVGLVTTDASGLFQYPSFAPDLLQALGASPSATGSAVASNAIVFTANDTATARLYTATYTESSRGLKVAGGYTAADGYLYGNMTGVDVFSSPIGVLSDFNITGYYFPPGAITASWDLAVDITPATGITANATGNFGVLVKIPVTTLGNHNITLVDANGAKFVIFVSVGTSIVLTPKTGYVGDTIQVKGYGFPAAVSGTAYNVTISWTGNWPAGSTATTAMAYVLTDAGGQFIATFAAPHDFKGAHAVTATVNGSAATDSKDFTLKAKLIVTPTELANAGSTVTVLGTGFSTTEKFTTNIDNQALHVDQLSGGQWPSDVVANATGDLVITFIDAGFGSGTHVVSLYKVGAAGVGGLTVTYFALFNVAGTESNSAILNQINQTVTSTGTTVNSTATTVAQILSGINTANAALVSIDGKIVTIQTTLGTISTSISSLPSSISGSVTTAVSNGLATITTSIGTITTKLDSIDAVIGLIAGDVVTLKTSVGDVTTSLTAINAKVVSINDNVATIVTDVGTIKGVVNTISGDVATIKTGVGTLQVDVSSIQPEVTNANNNTSSMSTMIYVAVAFAIIAAIAAVASILLMRKKIAS